MTQISSLKHQLLKRLKTALSRVNIISTNGKINSSAWISGCDIMGNVEIGPKCTLFQSIIGGNVTIGRYTSLWGPGVHVLGQLQGIQIGSFCSIAHYVSIQEDYHNSQRTTTYYIEKNLFKIPVQDNAIISNGPIKVGNDVWIGAGAQILSGITIGHGAIIGAGSVVTKKVPSYGIVAGNPAKLIRYRFEEKTIQRLIDDAWWDWSEERLLAEKDYLLAIHDRPL